MRFKPLLSVKLIFQSNLIYVHIYPCASRFSFTFKQLSSIFATLTALFRCSWSVCPLLFIEVQTVLTDKKYPKCGSERQKRTWEESSPSTSIKVFHFSQVVKPNEQAVHRVYSRGGAVPSQTLAGVTCMFTMPGAIRSDSERSGQWRGAIHEIGLGVRLSLRCDTFAFQLIGSHFPAQSYLVAKCFLLTSFSH